MQPWLLWLQLLSAHGSRSESDLRFTNWHDKLADRKKGLYEDKTQMLTTQTTRMLAMRGIARHMRSRRGQSPATEGTSLYEFGVYTGGGLRSWLRFMHKEGVQFSGPVWGFDSFEGMPHEDGRFKTAIRRRDRGWLEGGLNAAEQMGIANWETMCRTVISNIANGGEGGRALLLPMEQLHMVRGFYNESLAGGRKFAAQCRMMPALLVDLDCDLYTSSEQALRFVLEADILVPGSYIYMDDIMPWVWRGKSSQPALEQKLAYDELTREFGLEWEEVHLNATQRQYVHVRPVLMLKRCARCNVHREMRAKRVAMVSASTPAPPSCLSPALARSQ